MIFLNDQEKKGKAIMFAVKEKDVEEKEDLGQVLRNRSHWSIEALTRKAMQQNDLIDQLKSKLLAAANSGAEHCDISWLEFLKIDQLNAVTRETFDDHQCFQLFCSFLTTQLLNTKIISIDPVDSNTLSIRFSWVSSPSQEDLPIVQCQANQQTNCTTAATTSSGKSSSSSSSVSSSSNINSTKKSMLQDNFANIDFNYRFAASANENAQSKKFEQSISYF